LHDNDTINVKERVVLAEALIDKPKTGTRVRSEAVSKDNGRRHRQEAVEPRNELVDVTLLLFFAEVAETLSFTRAAIRLGIDQSWLSQKIRQLEKTLGVTLFNRNTRNVELTRAGDALFATARRLAEIADQARAATEMVRKSLVATLRLGALPVSFPDVQRAHAIDRFGLDHPDVEVVVHNAPTPQLLDKVRGGLVDLAFVSAPFDDTGLDCLEVREDHYCLAVPKDHSLASATTITMNMLSGQRIVMPPRDFNPDAYAKYYEPLIEAGVLPREVPEFQSSTIYARQWNLPVICTERAAAQSLANAMVMIRITDIPPCKKYLVRLSSHRTPSQIEFWEMIAEDLASARIH
jgi:DNA-binding transcriptional LysR family regulator